MKVDIEFDKKHLWHPYTSTLEPQPCLPVVGAEGVYIELETGEKLIDGMSSWWSVIHGYNHPKLNQALHQQADAFSHVMFGGLTHQPVIDLGKKLLQLAPDNMQHVFMCDSGSVAVEVSLKMALQYWQAKGEKRSKFLTLRHGYHGDTFAAMSVTDPDNSMHKLYKGFLPEHIFVDSPTCLFYEEWDPADLDQFTQVLENNRREVAAVILEPIVQGVGGMRFYHPQYLAGIRALCDQHGILLIADEIATGFGRTGKMFAVEHADIQPDILCLGKGLTGGYMSLAATLTTSNVAHTVCGGEAKCFMHGPTFMANPLACAVANASLEILLQNKWQQQVNNIQDWFTECLTPLQHFDLVRNVRAFGAIGVVETHFPVDPVAVQQTFVKHGVWVRPFRNLIYMMPPYISEKHHIEKLAKAVEAIVSDQKHFNQ